MGIVLDMFNTVGARAGSNPIINRAGYQTSFFVPIKSVALSIEKCQVLKASLLTQSALLKGRVHPKIQFSHYPLPLMLTEGQVNFLVHKTLLEFHREKASQSRPKQL